MMVAGMDWTPECDHGSVEGWALDTKIDLGFEHMFWCCNCGAIQRQPPMVNGEAPIWLPDAWKAPAFAAQRGSEN